MRFRQHCRYQVSVYKEKLVDQQIRLPPSSLRDYRHEPCTNRPRVQNRARAYLCLEPRARHGRQFDGRLLFGGVVQEDVCGLLQCEDARLGGRVGVLLQTHGRDPDQVQHIA